MVGHFDLFLCWHNSRFENLLLRLSTHIRYAQPERTHRLQCLGVRAIALATAVHTRGLFRILAVAIGSTLILTIAVSRLLLEVHTFPEVGAGLIIGTLSLALFGRIYLQSARAEIWPLIVVAAILLTILHGQELHAEEFLHHITGYFDIRCS